MTDPETITEEDNFFEELIFDDDFKSAVDELRRGRFEECIRHLDRSCEGRLSGLAFLFEQEKARLLQSGGQS
ncbi:hypothetical protein [uncultured Roseibium sp.]|uniref:hypothetical protein n=1 Tax=uncultured Roseibium sp. TaxID=1936171 RepID=UPI002610CBFA|nr:hypothetical protein [uncultured Roseibium sp.]